MKHGYTLGLVLTTFLSFSAHAALLGGLSNLTKPARKSKPKVLEVAMLAQEPQAPAPPEAPPPAVKATRPTPVASPVIAPQTSLAASPEPDTRAPPPTFGISLSSTGQGGSFAVAVGTTLMTAPDEMSPPKAKERYVAPAHALTKLPERQGDCIADYPGEARANGVAGQVVLDVEVLENGLVGEVGIVRGLEATLDAAAHLALRRCRFSPAEQNGTRVATRIRYTYTFVIED